MEMNGMLTMCLSESQGTEAFEVQVSQLVSDKIDEIKELNAQIDTAKKSADDAGAKVGNALERVKKAKAKADGANSQKVHWYGGKKEAIEALQPAVVGVAESQEDMVEAQKALAEAQKSTTLALQKLFLCQQEVTKTLKFLFWLGCANIAANRTVYNRLKKELEGASKEQLDDYAKHEIKLVMQQLMQQRDLLGKQEKTEEHIREQRDEIKKLQKKDKEQDILLSAGILKDQEQDNLLSEGLERDRKQDTLLAERIAKDEEQDKLLSDSVAKNSEQDKLLSERAKKDTEQDGRMRL